jgi:hypothetical protein
MEVLVFILVVEEEEDILVVVVLLILLAVEQEEEEEDQVLYHLRVVHLTQVVVEAEELLMVLVQMEVQELLV